MKKLFDNWCYNFSSYVSSYFWLNFSFSFLAVFIYVNIGFWFYFIYMFFYVLVIDPILVAKARDTFMEEMDLYVDNE